MAELKPEEATVEVLDQDSWNDGAPVWSVQILSQLFWQCQSLGGVDLKLGLRRSKETIGLVPTVPDIVLNILYSF